jgi:excisionase family DNA binding protein
MTKEEFITVPEAAKRAGRDQQTIYRWFREGVLTRYKVGPGRGRTRVSVAELDRLITPTAVRSANH